MSLQGFVPARQAGYLLSVTYMYTKWFQSWRIGSQKWAILLYSSLHRLDNYFVPMWGGGERDVGAGGSVRTLMSRASMRYWTSTSLVILTNSSTKGAGLSPHLLLFILWQSDTATVLTQFSSSTSLDVTIVKGHRAPCIRRNRPQAGLQS